MSVEPTPYGASGECARPRPPAPEILVPVDPKPDALAVSLAVRGTHRVGEDLNVDLRFGGKQVDVAVALYLHRPDGSALRVDAALFRKVVRVAVGCDPVPNSPRSCDPPPTIERTLSGPSGVHFHGPDDAAINTPGAYQLELRAADGGATAAPLSFVAEGTSLEERLPACVAGYVAMERRLRDASTPHHHGRYVRGAHQVEVVVAEASSADADAAQQALTYSFTRRGASEVIDGFAPGVSARITADGHHGVRWISGRFNVGISARAPEEDVKRLVAHFLAVYPSTALPIAG